MTTNFSRRLAVLMLTACVAASPALSQELIVGHTDAPVAKPAAKNPAIADEVDPLPPGAPTDDYQFMGWCSGILTGHMDLYNRVKPELDVISKRWNSLDEDNKQQADQQIEGRKLLVRFRGVMAKAEAQKPSLTSSGEAAVKTGLDNWAKIDTVDKQTQAYSWMNFGLPVQCETKVSSLEKAPLSVAKAAAVTTTTTASAAAKTSAPAKAPATAKTSTPVKTTAAAPAKPKSIASKIFGDLNPTPDPNAPLIGPGHIAAPGRSVVAELAAQEKAAKAAKKAKADAEASSSAAEAGLRQ